MKTQKRQHIPNLLRFGSRICYALKPFRFVQKHRRIVSALVAGFLLTTVAQLFSMAHISYNHMDQSVVAPFTIHLGQAITNVDMASLRITPATPGAWTVHQDALFGGKSLEFTPATGFKPGTQYMILPFTAKRLVGGTIQIKNISFSTVKAPAVVSTGLVTLADESTIAPNTSFMIKLADPNHNVRHLELISTPNIPVSLTTSDNDTTYTWQPKGLLPSGETLSIEIYDTRSQQAVAQKQVIVATAPQVTSFNEPTGFSQGDTARITFNEPIDASSANIQFDVAGSGNWESSTVYDFRPTTVQPAQTYHYTIAPGIRGTNGGLTNQPMTGSFSAFGHVAVSSYSPTGSGLNQASQTVSLTFNHAVDRQSAASRFSISSGTVTGESWNGNTFLVTVSNLGYGQAVTVTMASGVTSASFGLPSNQTTQFTFHTASETGVTAQLAYAIAEWDDTNNPKYGNLDSVGGDCANFVSQTLIARGWKMDSSWYNHGNGDWSAAWGYVPSMDDYLSANASKFGLQYLTASQRSQYAVGDVVIFSWEGTTNANSDQDHVEMISQITNQNGQISVKLASHNNYGLYRDLDEQITVEHPGATFHVWHLTRDTN